MDRTSLDVLAPNLVVVFCGINPAAAAAASGHNFSSRSNRFWPVLHLAGFTPERLSAEQDRSLLQYGCGLTTAVERPTRRASDLARGELVSAADSLERKIRRYAPTTLAFLGKAAFTAIAGRPQIAWGLQPAMFGGASVWVLPNPSGLNRSFDAGKLVKAYTALRESLAADFAVVRRPGA